MVGDISLEISYQKKSLPTSYGLEPLIFLFFFGVVFWWLMRLWYCEPYQSVLPLTLWVQIALSRGVLDSILSDKVCQWLAAGRWFSLVSSTNKTDHISEILLKVPLHTKHPPYGVLWNWNAVRLLLWWISKHVSLLMLLFWV